ncbi:hypothetical protein Skr01_36730 [Sphaerisporangium krabiense]|nr:hypothetical protein Skr01_36730 [Sphaerisporangium krabiense]
MSGQSSDLANTLANGEPPGGSHLLPNRLREHISRGRLRRPDHVRVDPKRDGRVRMPKPSGDHMHWDTGQKQSRRVKVPKVMQPRMG